jgi:hypothetical protein
MSALVNHFCPPWKSFCSSVCCIDLNLEHRKKEIKSLLKIEMV